MTSSILKFEPTFLELTFFELTIFELTFFELTIFELTNIAQTIFQQTISNKFSVKSDNKDEEETEVEKKIEISRCVYHLAHLHKTNFENKFFKNEIKL